MADFPFKITTTSFDPALAEITLQHCPADLLTEPSQPVQIQGKVIGPFCEGRSTIAIAYPLSSVSNDEGMVLKVRLPDPCFWSPDEPFLYRFELESTTEGWSRVSFAWGIKSLQLKKQYFLLNQVILPLRGVRLSQPLTQELSSKLRQLQINTLVVSLVTDSLASCAVQADTMGFHIIYQVQPDEEDLLWYAENQLLQHISTLGWLLPQASMKEPQLWHNAMLHLHGQRRDVFVGIIVDTVPLSMVQGHVEFLLVPAQYFEDLQGVQAPRVVSVRRFDLLEEELPTNLAGRISRVMPTV